MRWLPNTDDGFKRCVGMEVDMALQLACGRPKMKTSDTAFDDERLLFDMIRMRWAIIEMAIRTCDHEHSIEH